MTEASNVTTEEIDKFKSFIDEYSKQIGIATGVLGELITDNFVNNLLQVARQANIDKLKYASSLQGLKVQTSLMELQTATTFLAKSLKIGGPAIAIISSIYDGLLVRDLNENGVIDDGTELFGNNSVLSSGATAENGFEALADLDSNEDGVFDSSDTAWNSVKVWKDNNYNAQVDTGELLTLEQAGISGINLNYNYQDATDEQNNAHTQKALREISKPYFVMVVR